MVDAWAGLEAGARQIMSGGLGGCRVTLIVGGSAFQGGVP